MVLYFKHKMYWIYSVTYKPMPHSHIHFHEWYDSRLQWDPSHYGGLNDTKLIPDDVWVPDVMVTYRLVIV